MKKLSSKKVLIVDNYDSFTFNLFQQISSFGCRVQVVPNDCESLLDKIDFSHLVLSPGPKDPSDCGLSLFMLERFAGKKPILGVCLGHQIIGSFYGGKVVPAEEPVHGKTAPIKHVEESLFQNLPQNFIAARYHSLILEKQSIPSCFNVLATYDNIIMGIEHKEYKNLCGIQFHPESFLTEYGDRLMENFLKKNN